MKWIDFFEKRPLGWRDDDRAYKLLSAWGVKADPWEVFESLGKLKRSSENDKSLNDRNNSELYITTDSFKNSILFQKLKKAKGGSKIA